MPPPSESVGFQDKVFTSATTTCLSITSLSGGEQDKLGLGNNPSPMSPGTDPVCSSVTASHRGHAVPERDAQRTNWTRGQGAQGPRMQPCEVTDREPADRRGPREGSRGQGRGGRPPCPPLPAARLPRGPSVPRAPDRWGFTGNRAGPGHTGDPFPARLPLFPGRGPGLCQDGP